MVAGQRALHLPIPRIRAGTRCAALKWRISGYVQVFGRRHDDPFHVLWRPASKKRQGTKSREVGHRRCNGRYGGLMAAPSWRGDVTPKGFARRACALRRFERGKTQIGKGVD